MNTNNYNVTDINVKEQFENGFAHRDYLAHLMRWWHILRVVMSGERICDFGCGNGFLLEVLYRNRSGIGAYVGLDIREQTLKKAIEKWGKLAWAKFINIDLILTPFDYSAVRADRVVSFEVMEHVGKQNAEIFLQHFRDCGKPTATYYLSTPNHDAKVGAADNHTYDSGDGRGVAVQEHTHKELVELIQKFFTIEKKFGTFASIKNYKPLMKPWQQEMFSALSEYYESNMMSILMAPMFPEVARNTLWVLKRKNNNVVSNN